MRQEYFAQAQLNFPLVLFSKTCRRCIDELIHGLGIGYRAGAMQTTVGQDIFADMIFSRISRILTKPRKHHVREYDLDDFFY